MTSLYSHPEKADAISYLRDQVDRLEREQHPASGGQYNTPWRYDLRRQVSYLEMAIEALEDH